MNRLQQTENFIMLSAIGDALGFPIEFMKREKILNIYGKEIDDYIPMPIYNLRKGLYSDDTQLTISTIKGCMLGKTKSLKELTNNISFEYKEWFNSQCNGDYYERRYPGDTCLRSLNYLIENNLSIPSYTEPINNSKGNGALIRVAPISFLNLSLEDTLQLAKDISYITHCHSLGYMTAAYHSGIIKLMLEGKTLLESIKILNDIFKNYNDSDIINIFLPLIDKSVELSKNSKSDIDNIEKLGQGWVAEETLAIAVYCCLKYSTDIKKALVTGINITGDSDSVGIIIGNILGVSCERKDIPSEWISDIENREGLIKLANDFHDFINA